MPAPSPVAIVVSRLLRFRPWKWAAIAGMAAMLAAPLAAADANFQLYLLIGQSNMAGRGTPDDESKAPHPRVMVLTKQLAWKPATDPLHFDKPAAGVGPGLAFGKRMADANPAIRIGLIPCAVGGTSIRVWAPGAEDRATNTHPYDDMLRRVAAARQDGVLAGIIWHQGEADRGHPDGYAQALTDLVARLRTEFQAPEVPFVAGELAAFNDAKSAGTTALNALLHGLEGRLPRFAVVSADGLSDRGDHLHFDTASARVLGGRYAERMLALQAAR